MNRSSVAGNEVTVHRHGRHAQIAAERAHGEGAEALPFDELGRHLNDVVARERRALLSGRGMSHGGDSLLRRVYLVRQV